jgi:hypothetical protein
MPGKVKVDSCGCAMGARFMAVALGVSSLYYGWLFLQHQLSGLALVLRIFLITFLAAGAGKVIGILWYRFKRAPRVSAKPFFNP